MLAYVLFGGMIATTWVQIIKAVLLLFGVTLLARARARAVSTSHPASCSRAVAGRVRRRRRSSRAGSSAIPLDAISLGLALMFGTAGLPHILMRFYTVPDARAARDVGALRDGLHRLLLSDHSDRRLRRVGARRAARSSRKVDTGGNMAAPLLAEVLGGTPFLGFIAAVAFATILAVVAGLTLAGASALSHDIFAHVIRQGHGDRARAAARRARRDRRLRRRRHRARHPVQGPERRVHGRPRVRDRRERELPGAAAVDRLARFTTAGAVCSIVDRRAAVGRC